MASSTPSTPTEPWHRVIITGASKGFGNAFALCYANGIRNPVHFVLASRNQAQLNTLSQEITRAREASKKLTAVSLVTADFNETTQLSEVCKKIFIECVQSEVYYQRTIFLNNAGTLGYLRFIGKDNTSFAEMNENITLNLTTSLFFTSEFMKYYDEDALHCASGGASGSVRIINMSSLAAIQEFNSWGCYGCIKAAKEHFYKTLALERKDDARLKFLNYAPGPLDTNMQREIRESTTECPVLREQYTKLANDGGLVSPIDAAKKLLRILTVEACYTSGGHIDYYDVIQGVDVNTAGVTTCCACPFCTCGPNCQCKAVGAPSCDPCVVDISLKKARIERLDVVEGSSGSCGNCSGGGASATASAAAAPA